MNFNAAGLDAAIELVVVRQNCGFFHAGNNKSGTILKSEINIVEGFTFVSASIFGHDHKLIIHLKISI
jgi:hypothetical protein